MGNSFNVCIYIYTYTYIPARIEKISLRNEIEDFLRLVINETILDARTEDPSSRRTRIFNHYIRLISLDTCWRKKKGLPEGKKKNRKKKSRKANMELWPRIVGHWIEYRKPAMIDMQFPSAKFPPVNYHWSFTWMRPPYNQTRVRGNRVFYDGASNTRASSFAATRITLDHGSVPC